MFLLLGPKRDNLTDEWERLNNEELYALYASPNIIRVIKSRRLKCARHVGRMGREEVHTGFWWEGNIKMDLLEVEWRGQGLDQSGSG